MRTYSNYIAGRFTSEGPQDVLPVFNPATEEQVSTVPASPQDTIGEAIEAAAKAQASWAGLPAVRRAAHLHQIARLIREQTEPTARIISEEQGKPLGLARVEVEFAAEYIDYTAEWARRIEGEIVTSDRPNENIFLFRKPIGVVAGILPWNFPFFLVARKMAPALVTGNTIIIKPSEETPNNAFGETYVNRENFEAIQGFHAGWRKSGIGGADGKHGLNEFMQTHVVYLQHTA